MWHMKYLQKNYIPKIIYINRLVLYKTYCSDEKKKPLNTKEYLEKKQTSISVSDKFKNKSAEEVEQISFENESDIIKFVTTEKEKDATVRSRLSKECNKLLEKKIINTSTRLNFNLEQTDSKNSNYGNCDFDKTVQVFKKQAAEPNVTPKISDLGTGNTGGISSSLNRLIRGEPGKVLFAFIPEEWLHFFIPKTGVTGFYTFLITFGTFLVSKEYYVLEHNYYGGLSMLVLVWTSIKYIGPHLSRYLDKEIDEYENEWNQNRVNTKNVLEQQIDQENLLQFQSEGQLILMDAKRENVALQLEEEFRKRQMQVYEEVKKRLDYFVQVDGVYKKIQQKNLVEYVRTEVLKSVNPELQDKIMNISIQNLLAELEKEDNKK